MNLLVRTNCVEIDEALSGKWRAPERDAELERLRGVVEPWPDAADLTSPIGTEKVDALRSRIVRRASSEAPKPSLKWVIYDRQKPFCVVAYLESRVMGRKICALLNADDKRRT